LKFQDLPGIPRGWIDYIAGKYPEVPVPGVPSDPKFLHVHLQSLKNQTPRLAASVREGMRTTSVRTYHRFESLHSLMQSGSVAVVADVEADLFGGALSQFLKCLTAVKVSRELSRHAIEAVPVCWIRSPRSAQRSPGGLVRILDDKSEMHRLSLPSGPGDSFDQVSDMIRRIENIGKGRFDPETLGILKAAYHRDAAWVSACGDLFTALMDAWGLVTLDADAAGVKPELYEACAPLIDGYLNRDGSAGGDCTGTNAENAARLHCREKAAGYYIQSSLFPVFARIVDPEEIAACRDAHGGFPSLGLVPPITWPASSATVVDSRRRKILKKYNIRVRDLLNGEEAVTRLLSRTLDYPSIGMKLESLKMAVERQVADLNGPGMDGRRFRKAKERCRKHVVYQLDKMNDRTGEARKVKQEVMRRQIGRASGLLAPDGKRQEEGLAGIALPLLYSRSILSFLYENLDILKFEHQLIDLE